MFELRLDVLRTHDLNLVVLHVFVGFGWLAACFCWFQAAVAHHVVSFSGFGLAASLFGFKVLCLFVWGFAHSSLGCKGFVLNYY